MIKKGAIQLKFRRRILPKVDPSNCLYNYSLKGCAECDLYVSEEMIQEYLKTGCTEIEQLIEEKKKKVFCLFEIVSFINQQENAARIRRTRERRRTTHIYGERRKKKW